MHGYETAGWIVNFLCESNCIFGRVHFFDIASTATRPASKLADVSPAAGWQLLPMSKFPFVLLTGSHRLGRITCECLLSYPERESEKQIQGSSTRRVADKSNQVAAATATHHFIRSNVFCNKAKSVGWPNFSRVVSIHFFSSAFLVGRSLS